MTDSAIYQTSVGLAVNGLKDHLLSGNFIAGQKFESLIKLMATKENVDVYDLVFEFNMRFGCSPQQFAKSLFSESFIISRCLNMIETAFSKITSSAEVYQVIMAKAKDFGLAESAVRTAWIKHYNITPERYYLEYFANVENDYWQDQVYSYYHGGNYDNKQTEAWNKILDMVRVAKESNLADSR